VVEHPRSHRAVETSIAKRQVHDVADDRLDSASSCELDHARGLIERDDVRRELARHPLRELPASAPDLQYVPWLPFGDRREDDVVRVGSGRRFLFGHARGVPLLVGVRLPDELGVVQRGHTATVTRRKVAGMEVAASLGLVFWLLKSASSSDWSSASRPLAAAASNAFIVGP
jgi:hypothetical protein